MIVRQARLGTGHPLRTDGKRDGLEDLVMGLGQAAPNLLALSPSLPQLPADNLMPVNYMGRPFDNGPAWISRRCILFDLVYPAWPCCRLLFLLFQARPL